jgi:prolyl-tRNA synthetase
MSGALRNKLLVQSAKRLFQPLNIVPRGAEVKREVLPKCQRLMLDMGILGHGSNGMYHLLPLGYRALHKLERLIDSHLAAIGAQRIQMPILTKSEVWKSTSRYDTMGSELFKVLDRHGKEYLLSPTHEEAIAEFLSSVAPLSHNQLPLMLYQVTQKFRDEMKPRCGLLKTREFVMKDLYAFDRSLEEAEISYGAISTIYGNIFDEIGVPYVKVAGSTGMMGGVFSHEYQILAEIGEDRLRVCGKCGTGTNLELVQEEECKGCGSKLEEKKGIEVAHTFLLGTTYSQNLGATFKSEKGSIKPLVMASYGKI